MERVQLLNTFLSNLFIVVVCYTCHVLLTVSMFCRVSCSLLHNLVTVAQEMSTNQIASDFFDLVTVSKESKSTNLTIELIMLYLILIHKQAGMSVVLF